MCIIIKYSICPYINNFKSLAEVVYSMIKLFTYKFEPCNIMARKNSFNLLICNIYYRKLYQISILLSTITVKAL